MLAPIKRLVRSQLKNHGRHLIYVPRNEPAGLELDHDLPLIVTAGRPVIFDVGANVGQSIDLFSRLFPRSSIYAFEPAADCFALLNEKYTNERVRLFQVALSSSDGTREFFCYQRSVLNSLLPLDTHPANPFANMEMINRTVVTTRAVDSIIRDVGVSQIDLLKIDTQGWDYEVLLGAQRALADGRVAAVMVELNFIPMYRGQRFGETISSYLREQEFHLIDFYEKVRQGRHLAWCTALFSR